MHNLYAIKVKHITLEGLKEAASTIDTYIYTPINDWKMSLVA